MSAKESFQQSVLNLIFYSDLHGTRCTLGIAELVWAIALMWPGDTFTRPTYSVMRSVFNEEIWALLFLITAILQFYILLTRCYNRKFTTWFAGYNAFLWIFVVTAMYSSVYPPPAGISGELALACAAIWVFVRSGYNLKGRRFYDYG